MPRQQQNAGKNFQHSVQQRASWWMPSRPPQCTTASSCSLIFFYTLAQLPGTTCCSPSGLLLLSVFLLFSLHSSSLSLSPVAQTMGPWLQPAVGPLEPSESFQSKAQGLQGKSYNLARWCASEGMPMSAGIAPLFIHSLLSLFYSASLSTTVFYNILCRSWVFWRGRARFASYFLAVLAQTRVLNGPTFSACSARYACVSV